MKYKVCTLLLCISSIISLNVLGATNSNGYNVDIEAETEILASENGAVMIDDFRGYKWGTDFDEILAAEGGEIVQEASETLCILENGKITTNGNVQTLEISEGEVGGYPAVIQYGFYNNKLFVGGYQVDLEDADYLDMVEKYSSVYGDPWLQKESTGWGPCSLWIDKDKNLIYISTVADIMYFSSDEMSMNICRDYLENFHEIDIDVEMNKIGNVDGI